MGNIEQEQINWLRDRLLDLEQDQISAVVEEAWQEALSEAKHIIKTAMVHAIIERALTKKMAGVPDQTSAAAVPDSLQTLPAAAKRAGVGVIAESGRLAASAQPAGETKPLDEGANENSATTQREIVAKSRQFAAHEQPLTGAAATETQEDGGSADSSQGGEEFDREAIRSEIESIRRQLATNEALIQRAPGGQGNGGNGSSHSTTPPIPSGGPNGALENEDHPSQEETGYYVYCIVADDPGQMLESLPRAGIDANYPVYSVPYREILVVVSQVGLQEFGQEQLDSQSEDMNWVQEKAFGHQHVLNVVMGQRTLIPMRFCSIYQSEESICEMLEMYYEGFETGLAKLEGKQEWGVKVFFDQKKLRQDIEENSDRVREIKAQLEEMTTGAAYFMQKRLDDLTRDEAESAVKVKSQF